MNYNLFLAAWQQALVAARLQTLSGPRETIVLHNMARAYRDYVSRGRPFRASRFSITAELRWEWDALQSARSETVEEDTLMQLLGDERRDTPTEPPWLRVDVVLHATRPLGEPLPMPSPTAWRDWAAEVHSRLEQLLPSGYEREDGSLPVLSWRGEPEARLICQLDGSLALAAVELPAWQGVILPRQWDNPDRAWDDEAPDNQLSGLFLRLARALQAWDASLRHLRGEV
jgi:hypothetical protein